MSLRAELAEVEERAVSLRRQIAAATCREAGCEREFMGGANAGCGPDCGCSIPVYGCPRCGDSDYGDNDEARDIRAQCAARQ